MTVAVVELGEDQTTITVDDESITLPCGTATLGARHLFSDPPLPEELTNAIGEMMDHVEDAKRELPAVRDADLVRLIGPTPRTMAAVEIGARTADDEFELDRAGAEDVFRTLATESARDRRHNPGLPPDEVAGIVGGCCAVIGLIRGLQLDAVTVMMNVGP